MLDFSFIFSQVDLLYLVSLFCCVSRDIWTEQFCWSSSGLLHIKSKFSCLLHVLIHSVSQSLPVLWASSQFCIYYRVLCWLPVTRGGDKWIQQHLLGLTEGLNSFWTLLLPKLIILKLIMLCYPLKNRSRWGKYPPSCLLQPGAEVTSGICRTESIMLTRLINIKLVALPAFSCLQILFSETLFYTLAAVI